MDAQIRLCESLAAGLDLRADHVDPGGGHAPMANHPPIHVVELDLAVHRLRGGYHQRRQPRQLQPLRERADPLNVREGIATHPHLSLIHI